eukprot:359601_1
MTKPNHSPPTIKSEYVTQSPLLQLHIQTAGFKCELCDQKFQLKSYLIQHVTESHNLSIGTVKSEETFELTNHPRAKHDERQFQSNVNAQSSAYQNNSTCHQKMHSNETPFQCNVCRKVFKTHGILTEHMFCHSNIRSFPCSLCEKSFKFRFKLELHQRNHSDETQFHCNLCQQSFKFRFRLKLHQRIHSD